MHQSDWAFSGKKSWYSDHFGNDRLIDSDWIKRKSVAKKDAKDLAPKSDNNRRAPKKTGITRTKKSKTNSL